MLRGKKKHIHMVVWATFFDLTIDQCKQVSCLAYDLARENRAKRAGRRTSVPDAQAPAKVLRLVVNREGGAR